MKVFGFYFIYTIIWLIALLPLRILYIFSDLFYFLTYYIFEYRKKVVYDNLQHAFPEKSKNEIKNIAKGFYHHFADLIIETLKIIHFSKNQIDRRFKYKNVELFDKLFEEGKSVVLISGHYGNWEWTLNFPSKVRHKSLPVYKPLANDRFDKLINELRGKFTNNGEPVPMKNAYKKVIEAERNHEKIIMYFLSDQTAPKNYDSWIEFFHRETPFYTGPEKIAKKFGYAVVFMNIDKIKRGHYEVEFITLFDDPGNTIALEITQRHVAVLESYIRQKPELWLWSHRRWKHQKENANTSNNSSL
jgi:KDO2-lipid IV(A) lauroyltransferase